MKRLMLILFSLILLISNVNLSVYAYGRDEVYIVASEDEIYLDPNNSRYKSVTFTVCGLDETYYISSFKCDNSIDWEWGEDDPSKEGTEVLLRATSENIVNNKATFYAMDIHDNIHAIKEIYIYSTSKSNSSNNYKNTDEVTVYVNGRKVHFDQPPIIQNGRTLVPVRATCEAMDIVVDWTQEIQEVQLTKDNKEFSMRIGQSRYYTNKYGEGVYDYFDVPPQIINGRTLLPIRAIAEFFGYDVAWEASTNSVIIEGSSYSGNTWEDSTPEISWDEPEINFEDYIGVWDTFSSRYARYVDARIRIVDVDLKNETLDIDYKVDKDSQSMLTADDKLSIDDYPYQSITLDYYEKTLSNGKTALVTDVFELLDGDKVTIILDEDGNFGLGNSLGHSIIRNLE